MKSKQVSMVKHFSVLFVILFLFWTSLSGKLDVKHLTIGAVTSLAVTWITLPLLRFPSAKKEGVYLAFDFPVLKFLLYIPWLLKEVVKAAISVTLLVLDPKMPITPQVVTFKKPMSSPLAHLTLANSITLTPGTITVDLQDGLYTIHALTAEAGKDLSPDEGEGEMPKRVACLFQENAIGERGDL